jgi:hypothetical protein
MNYLIIILTLVGSFALLSICLAGFSLAPWVPTRKKDLRRINELANLKSGEVFYELGSGDSRVARFIALENPQAKVKAVERAWPLQVVAMIKQKAKRLNNLELINKDLFDLDYRDAQVVYLFGMKNKRIQDKLSRLLLALPPKVRIISYVFSFKRFKKSGEAKKGHPRDLPIHLYLADEIKS